MSEQWPDMQMRQAREIRALRRKHAAARRAMEAELFALKKKHIDQKINLVLNAYQSNGFSIAETSRDIDFSLRGVTRYLDAFGDHLPRARKGKLIE